MRLDDRVVATVAGALYSAEAWAVIRECREHRGEASVAALVAYGLAEAPARAVAGLARAVALSPLGSADPALWGALGPPHKRSPESSAARRIGP